MSYNKLKSFLKERGLDALSLLAVIVIWQAIADLIIKDSFLLPSFLDVVTSIPKLVGRLPIDASVSLLHWSIGLSIAICLGIPIGATTGWFKKIGRIFDPIIEVIRPIPPLAWIPFAIVWLGLTHLSAGFIVFIGAFFPILINTYTGFRGIEKRFVDSAKVLGCNKDRHLIRHIAFPNALPSIAAGVRIGMGIGWMCLVAAEIFGRTSGLGYKLWHFYQLHNMPNVVAYMIVLGLIGLLLDRGFRYFVEGKLLRWHEGLVT